MGLFFNLEANDKAIDEALDNTTITDEDENPPSPEDSKEGGEEDPPPEDSKEDNLDSSKEGGEEDPPPEDSKEGGEEDPPPEDSKEEMTEEEKGKLAQEKEETLKMFNSLVLLKERIIDIIPVLNFKIESIDINNRIKILNFISELEKTSNYISYIIGDNFNSYNFIKLKEIYDLIIMKTNGILENIESVSSLKNKEKNNNK